MNYLQQYHQQPQILHNQRIGFAPHLHDEVEIVVLFKGSAVLTHNGRQFPMQAGDCAFLYPGCVHSYASETAVDVGKFIFSPHGLPELEQTFAAGVSLTPVIRREQLTDTGIPELAAEILERYSRCTPMEQHAYLFLLAARLLPFCPPQEPPEPGGTPLNRVLRYCRERYRSDLTLDSVAAALFISPHHISHLFNHRLGMGFRDYVNLLRLDEAEALLRQSDRSVTEIASLCGFGSTRTLDRVFLRHRGMSPRDYRALR